MPTKPKPPGSAEDKAAPEADAPRFVFVDGEPRPLGSLSTVANFTGITSQQFEGVRIVPKSSLQNWEPITFRSTNDKPFQGFEIIDISTKEKSRVLEREIAALKQQRDEQAAALKEQSEDSRKQREKIEVLQSTVQSLEEKEQLNFLLERVNASAQKALLGSEDFRAQFLQSREVESFVMSVDIRRSTELMLKARAAEQFAAFITTLCRDLMQIVTECFGVVDKFTGDGILAFFPQFFSGADAGYLAITAASRCHEAFAHNYRAFRSSFNSILNEVGLGIGIDFGALHLVRMAGGLTVVGQPVVYACRLGGCPAGKTLLNQPAYEKISERFSANVFLQETELEIKHEGKMLAYE